MGLESLLGKIEEAAGRIRVIEQEKAEIVGKIQNLEREAAELKNLISLAEAKADEMLMGGPVPEMPRRLAAPPPQAPAASKGLEELVEPSTAQQEELKRRFPHAFSSS